MTHGSDDTSRPRRPGWLMSAVAFLLGVLATSLVTLLAATEEFDYTTRLEKQALALELLGKGVAENNIALTSEDRHEAHKIFWHGRVLMAVYGSVDQIKAASRYFYQRHKNSIENTEIGNSKEENISEQGKINRTIDAGFKMNDCQSKLEINKDVRIYQEFRRSLSRDSWISRLRNWLFSYDGNAIFRFADEEDEQWVIAQLVHNCLLPNELLPEWVEAAE